MKGRVAVLGQIADRRAAALIVDGKLADFLIEAADSNLPLPGAIYRAIVDRQFKGQGGIMLRLPKGSAFLRQGKGLSPGQSLLVQVTGYAEDGKAVPVTGKVLFKSRFAIVTPEAPGLNISRAIKDDDTRDALLEIAHDAMAGEDFGLIVRSSADGADPAEIADDITAMRDLARQVLDDSTGTAAELLLDGPDPHHLGWREWTKPDLVAAEPTAFDDHGVEDLLEPFRTPRVTLSGGASMFIEPTRALIAIDVNTGNDTSPATGLKANLAAARDLPRQLRIRGLGGQITLDVAPMPKKDRRQFEQALRAAFRSDPIETALVGWTPLGHFELQRKRERRPLAESLTE